MKVLITEKIDQMGIKLILDAGIDADEKLGISREELLDIIENYNGLIVRSATKVDKELLEKAVNLKVVGRAGNGMDNIDVEYAKAKGIATINTPDSNSIAAAEHTIGLLIASCRNIAEGNIGLKNKKWERNKLMGIELFNKTVGIVGLGRIGSLVATRLQAFGMKVIAFDPYLTDEKMAEMGVVKIDTINDLVKESDFITIHMPKTKETVGIIGEEQFKIAKKNLRIINCARGGLIDEVALEKALREGIIAGAALDVFVEEPCISSPLLDLDNVLVTPHLGASTVEAQAKAGITIAEDVVKALREEMMASA